MALRLIAASKTDVGLQREQNEDSCYAAVPQDGIPGSGLFIVAEITYEVALRQTQLGDAVVPRA